MTSKTLLNLPRSPWQSKRLHEAAKFTLCVRTHARDLSRYIALRVFEIRLGSLEIINSYDNLRMPSARKRMELSKLGP